MIVVPPGQVTLSDRRTQRSWSVELAPYQLAAFPITQARYEQVTGQRPSTAQGDQLPVESVSWLDAVRFCNALSQREGLAPAYRLPGARPRMYGSTDIIRGGVPTVSPARPTRRRLRWAYDCRLNASWPRRCRSAESSKVSSGTHPQTGTGYRPRPSGSTRVVPVRPAHGTGGSTRSLGIAATRTSGFTTWAASSPTRGACTTCWETFGTGAGTSTTPRSTAPIGCYVAVGGLTSTGAAGPRCGAAATRPSG